jgi:myosin-5
VNNALNFCVADHLWYKDQFEAMADELARRREECIQLRTLLASRSRTTNALASENYGGDPNLVNEDGELEMAYRTQKDLNKLVFIAFLYQVVNYFVFRLLENELQRVQKSLEQKEKEFRLQMDELKKDNDRQQKLIGQVQCLTLSGGL